MGIFIYSSHDILTIMTIFNTSTKTKYYGKESGCEEKRQKRTAKDR